MKPDRTFTDEELTAYLDGEADASVVEGIEQSLNAESGLAERIETLTVDRQMFKQGFDQLLDKAPEVPAFLTEEEEATPDRGWSLQYRSLVAAVAVACLAVGWSVGFLMSPSKNETWHEFVAAYQALYVNPTLNHVEIPLPRAEAELARVTQAIGKDIELAQLTGLEGLEFKRAQVLGFEGRPLIQLAFLSEVGAPIALCIIQSSDEGEQAVLTEMMEGMSAASWSDGGFEFLLIGGEDDALIAQAANTFSQTL